MSSLTDLQEILGVSFSDGSLLEQALVHDSYLNENPGFVPVSSERLEFLGDAVLGLIIAEKLYQDFPALDEGEMTRWRAALVRGDTLARLADDIKLGDYLYLGKGEDSSGGRRKPVNLAAALEAVIAAIFLDRGLAVTREFVLRIFAAELEQVVSQGVETDYKSELQKLVQARGQPLPGYYLLSQTGPDHDRTFTVEVRLGKTVLGWGTGKSKKAAEAEAALVALQKLSDSFTG